MKYLQVMQAAVSVGRETSGKEINWVKREHNEM